MFKKFVLATTLGLCLFGVSFGQSDAAEAAQRETKETRTTCEVKTAEVRGSAAGVEVRGGASVESCRRETVEKKDSSPRDSGGKGGGKSGGSSGGGRKGGKDN
jgi:hypothetical protein